MEYEIAEMMSRAIMAEALQNACSCIFWDMNEHAFLYDVEFLVGKVNPAGAEPVTVLDEEFSAFFNIVVHTPSGDAPYLPGRTHASSIQPYNRLALDGSYFPCRLIIML